MDAHDAQPSEIDTLVVTQLRRDAEMLGALAILLEARAVPTRIKRAAMSRDLAGVIAHCKAIRMALK